MYDKYTLKELKLHEPDNDDSNHYLSAVYTRENDTGIYEVTIPKINLPVTNHPSITSPYYYTHMVEPPTIDLGFGDLIMLEDKQGHIYYEKLIEEKVHDMTLSEIEQKLGYKVRVIS